MATTTTTSVPSNVDQPRRGKLLCNGAWVDAADGRRFESVNPYSGKVWATAALAGAADVDAAVNAATQALEGPWGSMTSSARGRLIRKLGQLIADRADELAITESTDNGKLLREMAGQMAVLPDWYEYFAGAADKLEGTTIPSSKPNYFIYTVHDPIGVVGAILPWNSPLLLLTFKLAPALAAGCTLVAKPAEQTPMSTLLLGELFEEAGFPPGVFNVVTGGGDTGRLLSSHPGVAKIAFTGSTATGIQVMKAAADHLAKVTLELGGKSPNIVFDDADLEAATNGVISGIFAATGQTCIAGSRLLVAESVHDDLVHRLTERAQTIKMGNPLDEGTEMGPAASQDQLDKILNYVDVGLGEGAELRCGGHRPTDPHLESGFFIEPTIFTGVRNDMRIAREEIFGPVLSVIPFKDEAEAVRLANESEYGLGAGVWTRDVQRVHRVARALRSGSVWVNSYRMISYNVPFGGYKQSGLGRENGLSAMLEYSQTKSVWIELSGATRDPFVLG